MSTSSDWSRVEVAVVQYPLVGGLTTGQLLDKVQGYVDTASSAGARLIVLPELFALDLLDFSKPEVPQFPIVIRELYPDFIVALQKLVTERGIYLLAGSIPVEIPETKKIRNRSFLFAPDKPAVHQDKLFLTPDEVEWGSADVEDAFPNIPVKKEDRRAQCYWAFYHYLVSDTLVLGAEPSPLIWGRLAAFLGRTAQGLFEEWELLLQIYVDDPLWAVRGNRAERRRRTVVLLLFWQAMGAPISWKKGQKGELVE